MLHYNIIIIIYTVRTYDLSHSYKNDFFSGVTAKPTHRIEICQIHPILLEDPTLELLKRTNALYCAASELTC